MNRRIFSATLAAALLLTGVRAFAQPSTWTIDPAHSQSDFQVRHMGISNVRGSISGIKGTIVWDDADVSKSSVEATLDANTVNTTVDARDKHLKSADFFNVAQYPTITFKSTAVTRANGKLQVIGNLTLAGVTKQVTLDVDGPVPPQKGMGGKMVTGFSATGVISRSQFNFGSKFPSAMLSDEVKFTLDVEANQ
ncbi:MAG: polyisoprenoid-binding protein [Acidobacteriota bacterium]|nr:polyisoprenoid-binding protein [Acidobacteriota bacterium]